MSLRWAIPRDGHPTLTVMTKDGLVVANGYERIVVGARGPYLEFTPAQVVKASMHVPAECAWRLATDVPIYYVEWRTTDGVKVYEQLRTVSYAGYKVGLFYVSAYDLMVDGHLSLLATDHPEPTLFDEV